MLRPSQVNLKSSAATWLEGQHSYNAILFAPPGWDILCFEDLGDRGSWSPHGIRGFDIAPCQKYYRYNEVLMVSNTAEFSSPPNYTLPSTHMTEENVQQAARELGQTLRDMVTNKPSLPGAGATYRASTLE